MSPADFVINARWVVPVVPSGVVLDHHALVVRDGRIADVLPSAAAEARYDARQWIERPGHALIPGLINAHTHAAMTLLRGFADDMPLSKWLEEYIWPAEMRWVSGEFVRDGTELAIFEMLRGGVTCFNDMYFFPDVVAQSALDCGIRAVVGMILIEAPTPWAADAEEYVAKGLAVHDRFRAADLITTAFAPHAPYSVADASFERIAPLANELDVPVHMHVHETAGEVESALAESGRRPLARLDSLGLVNPLLSAVHMTELDKAEIALIAARGASVIHCPESNLKLASGFCPAGALLAAGINVALGTDGAASNNDLDMFGEMKTAALLGKAVAGDAAAVSAERALEMATINGARALGIGDTTGSLEAGKWADLACVDLGGPATQPVHHPVSQLVYAAGRGDVTDTWVAGRHLLAGRTLDVGHEEAALARARGWQQRLAGIAERAAAHEHD